MSKEKERRGTEKKVEKWKETESRMSHALNRDPLGETHGACVPGPLIGLLRFTKDRTNPPFATAKRGNGYLSDASMQLWGDDFD